MAGQQPETEQWGTRQAHLHIVRTGDQFLLVRHSHTWRPPTDVMVDENHLVVVVEIAGMRDNDFNVALVNQQLSISGARPAQERAQAAYHQLEVRYGEFRVDISLPWPVDEAQVTARYDDGFLKVELPRARPHQITVVDVEKPLAD